MALTLTGLAAWLRDRRWAAVGLFAAIPAVIFYNKFSNDLNRFASKLEDFSQEFSAILSRELDAQELKKGLM